ncbi:hypothetical protein E2C01_018103 [Portunus trituberculatus]|uniref:Uncharacterized protein n=1 Tax=Portunus trituberculatus TaxID=210409 RepID=A0A5B7DVJ2_PORTR|nr:hypothetical protein [Portunus trituberculatus]
MCGRLSNPTLTTLSTMPPPPHWHQCQSSVSLLSTSQMFTTVERHQDPTRNFAGQYPQGQLKHVETSVEAKEVRLPQKVVHARRRQALLMVACSRYKNHSLDGQNSAMRMMVLSGKLELGEKLPDCQKQWKSI